jgi:RHS repeat-associated protein
METNETGQVISYEEYHPFGTSAYRVAKSGTDLSLKRYRFTGKERDDETGLYYFGVRYYAAWLGRWTSSDPGDFVDGLNLYVYVRNNPVNGVDAEGYSTETLEEPPPLKKKEPAEEGLATDNSFIQGQEITFGDSNLDGTNLNFSLEENNVDPPYYKLISSATKLGYSLGEIYAINNVLLHYVDPTTVGAGKTPVNGYDYLQKLIDANGKLSQMDQNDANVLIGLIGQGIALGHDYNELISKTNGIPSVRFEVPYRLPILSSGYDPLYSIDGILTITGTDKDGTDVWTQQANPDDINKKAPLHHVGLKKGEQVSYIDEVKTIGANAKTSERILYGIKQLDVHMSQRLNLVPGRYPKRSITNPNRKYVPVLTIPSAALEAVQKGYYFQNGQITRYSSESLSTTRMALNDFVLNGGIVRTHKNLTQRTINLIREIGK